MTAIIEILGGLIAIGALSVCLVLVAIVCFAFFLEIISAIGKAWRKY